MNPPSPPYVLLVGEARRAKMESYRKSRVVSDRKDKQADQ